MAISENLKAQIRGLKQAERNAQDGVSLVQIAEGGLSEEELTFFEENKISGYRVSKNILRIETAVLSIANILLFERNKDK